MKHDDPRLIDALAAEYVLGTLRGAARARFERWRAAEWHIDRRVQSWEERLAPLALSLPAVQPSPEVWSRIEQRISTDAAPQPAALKRRPALRAIAAVLVLVAVLAGGFAVWRTTQAPHYQAFATISNTQGGMAWQLEMDPDSRRMRMSTMPGAPQRPDRSFELWALPDSGAAPVSLGVLPDSGRQEHALSQAQMRAVGEPPKSP